MPVPNAIENDDEACGISKIRNLWVSYPFAALIIKQPAGGIWEYKMEQTEQIILLGFLYIMARIDLKEKELPLGILGSCGAVGVCFSLSLGTPAFSDMAGGVCVGGVLLLYALLTKEGIGYGDGLLFCASGVYLGLWGNLLLLFLATLLCAAAGGVLLIRKKCTRKDSVAFAPFVLAADVVMLAISL